ncbi:hypothetical protein D3C84_1088140 [compost metagenome]
MGPKVVAPVSMKGTYTVAPRVSMPSTLPVPSPKMSPMPWAVQHQARLSRIAGFFQLLIVRSIGFHSMSL